MKKKILLSVVAFFVVFAVALIAKAAQPPIVAVSYLDTEAKSPSRIPDIGATFYSTTTENFDFSAVKFKDGDGGTLAGKEDLEKIIIGKMKTLSAPSGSSIIDTVTFENSFDSDWFTAYCLDGTKKYPVFGLLRNTRFSTDLLNGDDPAIVSDILTAAIVNKPEFKNMVSAAGTYLGSSEFNGPLVFYTGSAAATIYLYELESGASEPDVIEAFSNGDEVTLYLKGFGFIENKLTSPKSIYFVANDEVKASIGELDGREFRYLDSSNHDLEKLEVKVKLQDIAYQKYTVANLDTSYNHALWIVEHTYPTLSLDEALIAAETSQDALLTEITTSSSELFVSGITDKNSPEALKLAQGYVYGVVQYAIWKSTGYSVNGKTLGDQITNSTSLNALYRYLIKTDGRDYSHYDEATVYSDKITVTGPTQGKDIADTTKDAYIYGPFTATYNALVEDGKMSVTIDNDDKTGLQIVDKDHKPITEIGKGENFYLSVSKKANVGSVKIKLSLANVPTLAGNRGRMYSPAYTLSQNAMSGGKVTNVTINGEIVVPTSAKTGVENIALLLMVTLVAFTLGYLVLSYKSKPVELQ